MFVPPPVSLTIQQIEEAKRYQKETPTTSKRKSSIFSIAESTDSLQAVPSRDSQTSTLKASTSRAAGFFSRKLKISSPTTQNFAGGRGGPTRTTSGETRKDGSSGRVMNKHPVRSFGKQLRKAPVPPIRPPRPSEDQLIPLFPGPPPPPPTQNPPPIPAKSPKRGNTITIQQPEQRKPAKKAPLFDGDCIIAALAEVKLDHTSSKEKESGAKLPIPIPQALTAPAAMTRAHSSANQPRTSRAGKRSTITGVSPAQTSGEEKQLSGVLGAKIENLSSRYQRSCAASSIRSLRFATSDDNPLEERTNTTTFRKGTSSELPWKRTRKGETMSVLVRAECFAIEGLVYAGDIPRASRLWLPLKIMEKSLPPTPGGVTSTPTETYHNSPRNSRNVSRNRELGSQKRSPLCQVASTNAKANNSVLLGTEEADASPRGLAAIPEFGAMSENSAPPSGTATPVATRIHLRGGSVITLTPPELTAWEKHLYVQGPIRLAKPTIVPRKNSVATLEPFQEAVDQIYQDKFPLPRRRSYDKVVDDIFDWFDDFGFEHVEYGGDRLGMVNTDVDEVDEAEHESTSEIERYSTPDETVPSPVAKSGAKKKIGGLAPAVKLALVESEELLRVKGIARLSRLGWRGKSREEPLTLPLPSTPLAEESTRDASAAPSDAAEEDDETRDQLGEQGFDWDDDGEEMDAESSRKAAGRLRRFLRVS